MCFSGASCILRYIFNWNFLAMLFCLSGNTLVSTLCILSAPMKLHVFLVSWSYMIIDASFWSLNVIWISERVKTIYRNWHMIQVACWFIICSLAHVCIGDCLVPLSCQKIHISLEISSFFLSSSRTFFYYLNVLAYHPYGNWQNFENFKQNYSLILIYHLQVTYNLTFMGNNEAGTPPKSDKASSSVQVSRNSFRTWIDCLVRISYANIYIS